MTSSCALLGGFSIGAWLLLLWQHSAEHKMSASACTCCMPGFGSRPSDHYFRNVCWFVCLFVLSFSQPSLIRFRSN